VCRCLALGERCLDHRETSGETSGLAIIAGPNVFIAPKLLQGIDEGGGTRTHDLGIKSPLLYQLSYAPQCAAEIPSLEYPNPLIQRQPRPAEQNLISATPDPKVPPDGRSKGNSRY
jgi:hypothetical protein